MVRSGPVIRVLSRRFRDRQAGESALDTRETPARGNRGFARIGKSVRGVGETFRKLNLRTWALFRLDAEELPQQHNRAHKRHAHRLG